MKIKFPKEEDAMPDDIPLDTVFVLRPAHTLLVKGISMLCCGLIIPKEVEPGLTGGSGEQYRVMIWG